MRFRKVEVPSTVDAVVDQVKSMILDGVLKPSDKLPSEIELAKMLDVGRATVREALRTLQSLGLIERTREGTFVRNADWHILNDPLNCVLTMNPHSYSDLWECRIILEKANAELAAKRAREEDLQKLCKFIDEMAAGIGSNTRFVKANFGFHRQIAVGSRNPIFVLLYSSLTQAITQAQMRMLSYDEGVKSKSLKQHRELYDAIARRDSEAAGEIMLRHLAFTREAFREEDANLSAESN